MNNSKKSLNKWEVHYYGSGTVVIVPIHKKKNRPHYYVYGHPDISQREREDIAKDICNKLNNQSNGEYRNVYMPYFGTALTISIGFDDLMIGAVGPNYDRNPPALDWWQRNRPWDKLRRWLLTRRLYKALIK